MFVGLEQDYVGSDSEDRISRCLNCELTDCINCFGEPADNYDSLCKKVQLNKHKLVVAQKEVLDYYLLGYVDKEIAEHLGINEPAASRYRRSMGLPILRAEQPRERRKIYAKARVEFI